MKVYHPWKSQVSVFTRYWEIEREILEFVDTVSYDRKYILQNFLTLLETFIVSTKYVKIKSITSLMREIYGIEKWENEKFSSNNRKWTARLPVGSPVFDTSKEA